MAATYAPPPPRPPFGISRDLARLGDPPTLVMEPAGIGIAYRSKSDSELAKGSACGLARQGGVSCRQPPARKRWQLS